MNIEYLTPRRARKRFPPSTGIIKDLFIGCHMSQTDSWISPQIHSWLPHCNPVVIPYFCTSSSSHLSAKQLLLRLSRQISISYNRRMSASEQNSSRDNCDDDHNDPNCSCRFNQTPRPLTEVPCGGQCLGPRGVVRPDLSLSELRGRLCSLLTLKPSPKQPVCLVLDGLDHMEKTLWSELLSSIPTPLPPNVKVILTASSPTRAQRDVALLLVPLPGLERKQCLKMVASLLSGSGRTVTSGQQVLVNRALSSCHLPLYARLLHWHTSLWRSGKAETD